MKNNLTLSIPNPCRENWNDFTEVSNGRFCSSCSKVVIDFTTATDEDILDFFKDKPSHTCGRFKPNQLRAYSIPEKISVRPGAALLRAGLLSLGLFLVSKQGFAQTAESKIKIEHTSYQADHDRAPDRNDKLLFVAGVVTGADDSSAVPGVNVWLKGTINGTITDVKGRFEFRDLIKVGDVLCFDFIGFKYTEYTVTKQNATIAVLLEIDHRPLAGELIITRTEIAKQAKVAKWWGKVKSIF